MKTLKAKTLHPRKQILKISELTYVPAYRIPVRLYANRDTASGDTFWNKYFMGGKFGDKIYPRLIDDETIFYDVESLRIFATERVTDEFMLRVVATYTLMFSKNDLIDDDLQNTFFKTIPKI